MAFETLIQTFHFIRPAWLLALLPLTSILFLLGRQVSQGEAWRRQCDPHLLPHILVGQEHTRRLWPLVLLGFAWLLATLALAGPSWERLPQPVYHAGAARVIVLDLSSSMDATDILPSRLSRAKFKVIDLLKRLSEGQTGLVVFTSQAFVVSPLTQDASTISAMIPELSTEIMPVQGQNLAPALTEASKLLTQAGASSGDILVITDSPVANDALVVGKKLRQQGFRTSIIGIGSRQGAPIPLTGGGFAKDARGSILLTKLQASSLKKLANQSGGAYQTFSTDDHDINTLLREDTLRAEGAKKLTMIYTRWQDDGYWLLLGILPLAGLAFRRGWIDGV